MLKSKEEPIQVKCPHYVGEGYTYDISGMELCLCDMCNLNLAGEFAKAQAVHVYSNKMLHGSAHRRVEMKIEELRKKVEEKKS